MAVTPTATDDREYDFVSSEDDGGLDGWDTFTIKEPLTVSIKGILRDYADSTQIARELLQNSDDARSTSQWYLLDHHDHRYHPEPASYEPEQRGQKSVRPLKLADPRMSEYMGPALLAGNDSLFEERDFESLQNLRNSGKKDDVLKTGQMGIGFNSVYHLTDCPSFISGDRLVIMEPHARILDGKKTRHHGSVMATFNMASKATDQFKVFSALDEIDFSKPYPGTIFRIPLRTEEQAKESDISSSACSAEKAMEMLMNLKNEAVRCLLFLKYVEKIAIYERHSAGETPTRLFMIEIENVEEVRESRKQFLNQLRGHLDADSPSGTLDCTIRPKFKITEKDGTETHETWQVTSMVGNASQAREFMNHFKTDIKKLRMIPWVGIASPMGPKEKIKKGELFCFQSLGMEIPFPVHIHGHFAVNQSRSGIYNNEKGELSEGGEQSKLAHWNKYLIDKVIPVAYARFLENMGVDHDESYGLWPNPITDERGSSMLLQGLLTNVLDYVCSTDDSAVFLCGRSGEKQARAFEDCKIAGTNMKNYPLILDALHDLLDLTTDVPMSVVDALRGIMKSRGQFDNILSPSVVREILLHEGNSSWQTSETVCDDTRVQMLNYCIKDGKVLELEGLELLPMADGAWVSFGEQSRCDRFTVSESMYDLLKFSNSGLVNITMKDLPLLQFREDQKFERFLSVMPSEVFAKRIITIFKKKLYGADDPTPGLINRTKRGDFPSRQWIAEFWATLHETEYPHAILPLLKHQHLLLVTGDRLAPLDAKRPVIDCRDPSVSAGEFLDEVKEMLEKRLLCPILDVDVDYSVAKEYLVKLKDVPNILRILEAVDMKMLKELSQPDRETLCKFMANGLVSSSRAPSPEQVSALKMLPIYRGFINTGLQSLASFQHARICKGFTADRLQWKLPMVDLLQESQLMQQALKSILCVPSISETEYWFRLFERLDEYPIAQWDNMIKTFCRKFYEYTSNKDFDVAALLRERAFVIVAGPGCQVRIGAEKRINPCRTVATSLAQFYMKSEEVFPTNFYAEEPVVSALKALGMKTPFNAEFVIERIEALSASVASGTDVTLALEPLKALSTHLQAEFRVFEHQKSCNLQKVLREARWIPGRVSSHPSQMQLYTAEECCHPRYSDLVGDAMPISDFALSDLTLLKFLGWDRPPPLDPVLRHMLKVIEPHQAPDCDALPAKDDSTVRSIYAYLLDHLSAQPENVPTLKSAVEDKRWILIEKKLHATDRVTFDLPVQLGNHIIKLPSSHLDKFFSDMGVRQSISAQELVDIISNIGEQYQDTAASEPSKGRLTESDSQLVLNILEYLSRLNYTRPSDLLILTKDAELCRVADVVYDDMNVLQDSLATMLDEGPKYTFASPSISLKLAADLEIPRLRERFLQDREDATFKFWAQEEDIVERVRGILNDYDPESIFVEFLQNAEDAGATEFVCMLDQREYDTEKLLSKELAAWQGPALVFFNNAEFTEEDFQALSKLGVGGKRGDASKIGRYGLGFNSVYHFTDVPSVLSGSHIGFFDPHRKYLPKIHTADGSVDRGGIRCDFRKLRFDQTFVDQAAPYMDLFGCNMVDHFKGTIFRIPLRTASNEPGFGRNWDVPHVQKMLNRWAEDAKVGTLFLENIQIIKLNDGGYAEYSVTRTDVSEISELSSILDKRTVPPSMNARIFNISSTTPSSNSEETHRWMVSTESEFLEDTSPDIRALAIKNRWRPHCGIAFPLGQSKNFKGRMFSHVPTMVETELPFHIHGVFALLSNRKGLSGGQHSPGDDKATWNMYVCHQLLPLHIVRALEILLEFHFAESFASKAKPSTHDVRIATKSYFKYWPSQQEIAQFNSQLLEAFWRSIHSHAVFPCLTKSGESIIGKTGKAATFPDEKLLFSDGDGLFPVAQKTNKLLRSAGVAICEHSDVIVRKVQEAWAVEPALTFNQVNPEMLRMHMRQSPTFIADELKSKDSQMCLLEYLLADLLGPSDPYQSIYGLGVIPLMNGEWKCLYNSPKYFTAPKRMQELLDAKEIFVNEDIFGTPNLGMVLTKLKNDKRFGISEMEPEDFTKHFCAENEDVAITRDKHIQVWKYLTYEATVNNNDIADRCGKLPILKTKWGHFKPLEDYSTGLQIADHMDKEFGVLMPIFQHLRIPIFNPTQFQGHPEYISNQRFERTVLTVLGKDSSWADSLNINKDQASTLRKMILEALEHLSPELVYRLGRLRIWESHGAADSGTGQRMIAAWEAYVLSSNFPDVDRLGDYRDIIRDRNVSLIKLGARELSLELFARDKALPYLRSLTPDRARQHRVAYVNLMERLFILARKPGSAFLLLSEGRVMMTREGSFRTCRQLMDPDDNLLTTVFEGVRNMFPDARLWSEASRDKASYNFQSSVEPDVATRCVLKVMERIAQDPLSTTVRSMAQMLVRHAYAHCSGNLSTIEWDNPEWKFVPAELTGDSIQRTCAPDDLPSFMGFRQLVSRAHRDLVWTQRAFFPEALEPPTAFKTRYPAVGEPTADDIVNHLRVLVKDLAPKWTSVEHQLMLKSTLCKVYQALDDFMGEPGYAELLPGILESTLRNVAFILYDNNSDTTLPGSWSKPQDLMFGIRKQTRSHRTVSPWLLHYRRFLVAAGVMEISTPEGHDVDVPEGRTLGVLEDWMRDCFETRDANVGCMDVKYVFSEGREILAHKVVLVHGSEFFKGKFTGPWGDICTMDGLKVVIDHSKSEGTEYETKYEVFWGLLYYLYTDKLIKSNGPVDARISSTSSVKLEGEVEALSADALKDKKAEERVERTMYLLDLLDMANMHGLERLKLMISSEVICDSFEHDHLPSVRYHARKSVADKLVAYCDEFMKKNKDSLIPVYRSDIDRLDEKLEKMRCQKEEGDAVKTESEEEVEDELEEKKATLAELLAQK